MVAINVGSSPLWLTNLCKISCETGENTPCHPIICFGPYDASTRVTEQSWDGTYYTLDSILDGAGQDAGTCARTHCAEPGQYAFEICAFINPNPGIADGCSLAPSSTPSVRFQVPFDYPATAPVVAVLPQ